MDATREGPLHNDRSRVHQRFHGWYVRHLKPRSTDEDDERREYILNILLLGSIILLILLDFSVLYYSLRAEDEYRGVPFVLFSLLPLFFLGLYILSRRGHFIPAAYLMVGVYAISNSWAAYHWGVNLQPVVLGYALLIVIASILISTRFGFVVTACIAAFTLPLWHLQRQGTVGTEPWYPNASDAAVFAAIYSVIMIAAWLSNREIERSLFRARRSESALTEERDLLEVRVEERTRELRDLQLEKVDQLYRFAEFGKLASGLFHDLINVLTAVSLRNQRQYPDVQADATTAILRDAPSLQEQIRGFIESIRKQLASENTSEYFSLTAGITDVMRLLSYKAKAEEVELILELPPNDMCMHFGNPLKFHQVLLNLVMNGIESYAPLPHTVSRARSVTARLKREGERVIVRVLDTGTGIPAADCEKIFEPFFTTKPDSRGIGIGLATVRKIVEQDLQGTLVVESREGTGSVFIVSFPLCEAPITR